jgi:hypothetical protein
VTIKIDPGSVLDSDKVDGIAPIMVMDKGFDGVDRLVSIEKIKLTGHNETVTIGPTFGQALETLQEVDANTQDPNSGDVLDLRPIGKSITFDHDKILGFNTIFKNFNVLQVNPGNDTVILDTSDASRSRKSISATATTRSRATFPASPSTSATAPTRYSPSAGEPWSTREAGKTPSRSPTTS